MNAKSFSTLAGVVFSVGALAHVSRLVWGWPVVIGAWDMPLWVSWLGLLLAGTLGWLGLRAGAKG